MNSRLSKTLLVVSLVVLGSFLLAKIKVPYSGNSKQLTALLPLEKNIADSVGVYFWGGSLNNPEGGIINAGEKLAKNIGSQNLRIAMSAKSDSDYKGGSCISNFSLKDLAQRQDFQKILSDPSFKTVMITAYDGASFSDCSTKNYLDPNFYTSQNTQRIQQEYNDFAKYLATFGGKTFIISNWEGDNDIYCGAAFGASASGCPSSQQNIEGFKKWINARTAGIKSSGAGNVFSAVEFNIVRDLKNRGLPSVLYNVIPNVNADYFSYSSYESINALYSGDDGSQLRTDIATIKNVLSTNGKNAGNLVVGEFGFDQGSREEIKNKLQTVAGIAADSGVKYSFVWNLLDAGGPFGLYDSNVNLTVAGKYFCNLWSGSACAKTPTPTPSKSITLVPTPAPASGVKGGLVPCGRLQDDPSTPDKNETDPCATCDLFALASRIINFVLFTVVPAVAVLFYLIGGLMILLGGAYPGLVTTGRNFFWNTTIGLFIIFGAWMITNTVLKSLVGDSDISNNWFRIECVATAQQLPPTTRYTCGSLGCVAKSDGEYATADCNGRCAPAQKFYMCNDNDQCVEDPQGNVAESYTASNCDNECQPAAASPPVITTTTLSDAVVSQVYAQSLNVSGGSSPYTFSLMSGSLPPGLTLSTSGIITGTPTTANTYTFTVKVEDSTTPTKQSATKELSVKIVAATAGVQCLFSGVNLCQGVTPPGGCSNSKCSQYTALINKYASGAATANLLKALMFAESSCDAGAATGSSFGLMQLQPATANTYRQYCGVQVAITSSWLTNPANAEKSICIAAQYVNAIAKSRCGSSPRNIYAGYNGGTGANGACGLSVSCAGEKNCEGGPMMRWECLYDDKQHTVCNGGNDILDGYNQTKAGARKITYCNNNPGF